MAMTASPPRSSWIWVVAILVALGVGDWLFQLRPIARHGDLERQRYTTAEYRVDPSLVPGASERSRVVLTGQALRGDYFARDAFNIVVLGGSTVFCKLLDEEVMLSAQIANAVPAPIRNAIDLRVAVAALPGQRIDNSTENFSGLLDDPDTRPDIVIGQFGSNDMARFLRSAPWPPGAGPEGANVSPDSPFLEPQRSLLLRHRADASKQGHFIADLRRAYSEHPKLEQLKPFLLPIYRHHLDQYEHDLQHLVDLTQRESIGLMLLTQALNYGGDDQPARSAKYWITYPEKRGGFVPSPRLMSALLDGFNDRTRKVAAARGVPLVDVARDLGSCADCFYDQWHLTVSGAQREGTQVAEALLEEGLLGRRTTMRNERGGLRP